MAQLKSPMDILKILPRTNCRDCRSPTCLAFAAEVFNGRKKLEECPHMSGDIIERFGDNDEKRYSLEQDIGEYIETLKKKVASIDLEASADRLGARYSGGMLTIPVLGKDFKVSDDGSMYSDIHINPWVVVPILNYILECKGAKPTGKWVPLRELEGGREMSPLFVQRCEKPLKKIADEYTDLFEDMIHIFNGRQVENHYESDISLVLRPLPKIPVLICYWKPEDGMESNLNFFFDSSANENIEIGSAYRLGAGLITMFEKIARTHG